jgi:TatD DNase family protein
MIETDSPYMTPEPYRGHRNEPVLVQYVAKRIAEIKDLKLERIAEATTETARRFFRI